MASNKSASMSFEQVRSILRGMCVVTDAVMVRVMCLEVKVWSGLVFEQSDGKA